MTLTEYGVPGKKETIFPSVLGEHFIKVDSDWITLFTSGLKRNWFDSKTISFLEDISENTFQSDSSDSY